MISISENVHINKLDAIVDEYNNTNNRTIKMNPVDVKPSTYFDFDIESNDKDPRSEVGDCARISKYKNIFCKMFYSKFVWRSFYD